MANKTYQITLHAYYPEKYNGNAKGDYIGGVTRIGDCIDLEQAIEKARESWRENFKGAVKQVRVSGYDWGQPGMALFESDNFKELKKDKSIPF